MYVVLSPERRVEVPPDPEVFGGEIEREFSEVAGLIDELYDRIALANEATDHAFEREAVWPPSTWLERLETSRVTASLPYTQKDAGIDLLGKFPSEHPFRKLVTLPARFASGLAPGVPLPPLALARLHGSWTRGLNTMVGGAEELEEFLIDRITAHGGRCMFEGRATSLALRRGRVVGVVEESEEEAIGTDAVLCALSGEQVADLTGGEGVTKQAQTAWPRLTASSYRFVVSLVVKSIGLPTPLGQEAFLIPPKSGRSLPEVHLQRLAVQTARSSGDTKGPGHDETLLVAEALSPRSGERALSEERGAVLETLFFHFPHLEEHLVAVDSPHDGLPAYDYSAGPRRLIDRIHIKDTRPSGEPMEPLWMADPPGYLGIGGEPLRGPIKGSYLIGQTVLPGLGQEGELLAAWSVARVLTKRDSVRQKQRHLMWSKMENS
jgi:phytoene dehydrogenase-like protein